MRLRSAPSGALSSLDTVDAAKADLAFREGIDATNIRRSIGVWQRDMAAQEVADAEIAQWAQGLNLDAVIRTNLKPRFGDEERVPTVDEVIGHIKLLSTELRTNAERYIRNTPIQINTAYRRRLTQEFGWTPQASR